MRMSREESTVGSRRKYKRMASGLAFVSSGNNERGNLPVKQPDWNDMARGANLRERNQQSQACPLAHLFP